MPQQTYNWKRFWCPTTRRTTLYYESGYLYSPDAEYGKHLNPDVIPFAEMASIPCLVLLGEAGMGKSTTVEQAYQEIKNTGAKCLWFPLGDYGSEPELCQAIFRGEILQDWLQGDEHLYLFLDSLDEGRLNIKNLARILKREIGKLPCERLSLRITCRTADWDSASPLQVELQGKYDNNVGVYELAPLTRLDVIEAARINGVDPDSFVQAVFDRDAVPLAIKPTTLKFLINTYKQNQQFPATQKELYFKGCKSLCIETNLDRIGSGEKGQLSECQRLVIAARIAAIFIFANRSAIWTGIDLGDVPSSDIALTEICFGSERIDELDFQVIEKNVREVFSITGLFSSRGDNRLGFAHQTYAEFLAAWYVAEHRNLPLVQIMSLLTTPEDPEKRLVPQLHETAIWIASMRQDVLKQIVQTDPDVILRSDIPTDSSFKEDLVENLLKRYEQGLFEDFDYRTMNYKYLNKLKHPNLANQLLPYIQDSTKNLQSRHKAIDIAECCEEKYLQDVLADLALNDSENIHLRGSAAYAITLIGDSNTKGRLKPLAISKSIEDGFHRLKDYSLIAVFPEHLITVEELFDSLTSSKTNIRHSKFLSTELIKYLNLLNLPIALNWIINQGVRHYQSAFTSAANAIIRFSIDYMEDPNILELITKIAMIQWKQHHSLITETSEFENLLLNSENKRRLLLESIILRVAEKENLNPYDFSYLVRPVIGINLLTDDFIWLVEKAKAEICGKRKTIWIHLIDWSFNRLNVIQIDALFFATREDLMFQTRFGGWFTAIDLDSSEAKIEQERYQEIQKSVGEQNIKEGFSDQDIKERINYRLNEFENGNIDAWWWLNRDLTLEPDSYRYENELNIDITNFYGWKLSEPMIRKRILNAAKEYVNNQSNFSDDWIGTNKYSLTAFPSFAACRALYLLLKVDLSALTQISTDVWVKWTPTILDFPNSGDAGEDINTELIKRAYSNAPVEFINTLLKLIDSQSKQSNYIFIIRKLERCWDDLLKNTLLDKIKLLDLHPKCVGQLLEELLKRDHKQSRDFAMSLLVANYEERQRAVYIFTILFKISNSPNSNSSSNINLFWKRFFIHCSLLIRNIWERAVFATESLIKYPQISDWDIIWNNIIKNPSFAKETLERASHSLRHINLNLNEKQLADLYIWLESNYPHTEDPVYDTVHSVESRESLAHFRDGLIAQLRETGTLKACQEIHRIIEYFPNYDLKWHLIKAQNALRKKSWKPPEPKELMQLVNNSDKRLIQDGNQLLDVLIESLKRLELKLQGETPAARDIWDLDSKNTFKPINENLFSNYVKRHFDQDLKLQGIFANREVELRSKATGVVQERTDIHVDAVIRNYAGEITDSITVIIEAKGCWHDELDDAMQTQLVNQYLQDNQCQYGLYLIGWFNCSQWDKSDSRCGKSPKITLEQAREKFTKQAEGLSQGGVNVKSFVLNTSLR